MEHEFTEALQNVLENEASELLPISSVRSFREAGVMTNNNGLVVRLANGEEFQITVVQSRR